MLNGILALTFGVFTFASSSLAMSPAGETKFLDVQNKCQFLNPRTDDPSGEKFDRCISKTYQLKKSKKCAVGSLAPDCYVLKG